MKPPLVFILVAQGLEGGRRAFVLNSQGEENVFQKVIFITKTEEVVPKVLPLLKEEKVGEKTIFFVNVKKYSLLF